MSIVSTLSPNQALPQGLPVYRVIAIRATIHVLVVAVYFCTIQFFTSLMNEPQIGLWNHIWLVIDDNVYWVPGLLVMLPLMAFDWANVCRQWEQNSIAPLATIQNAGTTAYASAVATLTDPVHEPTPSDPAR